MEEKYLTLGTSARSNVQFKMYVFLIRGCSDVTGLFIQDSGSVIMVRSRPIYALSVDCFYTVSFIMTERKKITH